MSEFIIKAKHRVSVLEVNHPIQIHLIYFIAIECRYTHRVIYTGVVVRSGDQVFRTIVFPRYSTIYIYIYII